MQGLGLAGRLFSCIRWVERQQNIVGLNNCSGEALSFLKYFTQQHPTRGSKHIVTNRDKSASSPWIHNMTAVSKATIRPQLQKLQRGKASFVPGLDEAALESSSEELRPGLLLRRLLALSGTDTLAEVDLVTDADSAFSWVFTAALFWLEKSRI